MAEAEKESARGRVERASHNHQSGPASFKGLGQSSRPSLCFMRRSQRRESTLRLTGSFFIAVLSFSAFFWFGPDIPAVRQSSLTAGVGVLLSCAENLFVRSALRCWCRCSSIGLLCLFLHRHCIWITSSHRDRHDCDLNAEIGSRRQKPLSVAFDFGS
jgi:hypothetical protein